MTATRLVVFDVDGTLIDSQHLILDAMSRAFDAAGHPLPLPEAVLAVVGLSLPEAMAALAPHLPPEETLGLAARYREGFLAQRAEGRGYGQAPLYPGARAALERLAAEPGTLMGVATGKARRGLEHVLAAHDLAPVLRHHPDLRHASLQAAPLDAAGGARRDRRARRPRR